MLSTDPLLKYTNKIKHFFELLKVLTDLNSAWDPKILQPLALLRFVVSEVCLI